jgi:hypothetical protein
MKRAEEAISQRAVTEKGGRAGPSSRLQEEVDDNTSSLSLPGQSLMAIAFALRDIYDHRKECLRTLNMDASMPSERNG